MGEEEGVDMKKMVVDQDIVLRQSFEESRRCNLPSSMHVQSV